MLPVEYPILKQLKLKAFGGKLSEPGRGLVGQVC
jgi:hypothetical protein